MFPTVTVGVIELSICGFQSHKDFGSTKQKARLRDAEPRLTERYCPSQKLKSFLFWLQPLILILILRNWRHVLGCPRIYGFRDRGDSPGFIRRLFETITQRRNIVNTQRGFELFSGKAGEESLVTIIKCLSARVKPRLGFDEMLH